MSALFLRGPSISNKLYAFLFNSSHYLSKNFFAKRLPLITQPYLATLGGSYWSFQEKASVYAMRNEVPHSRKITQQGIFFLPWARISMKGMTFNPLIKGWQTLLSRAKFQFQECKTTRKKRAVQNTGWCNEANLADNFKTHHNPRFPFTSNSIVVFQFSKQITQNKQI